MKKINIRELAIASKLFSSFDNVIHEMHEHYQTLELSNNVNKGIIEKEVYLVLNIAIKSDRQKNALECLSSAIQSLLPFMDLLINYDTKENNTKQLNLFSSEDDEVELESEPKEPSGEDASWESYFKKRDKVRLNNLKKKYSFFELFDIQSWTWAYNTINYKNLIPTATHIEELLYRDLELVALGKEPIDIKIDKNLFEGKYYLTNAEISNILNWGVTAYFSTITYYSTLSYDQSYTIMSNPNHKCSSSLFKLSRGMIMLNDNKFKNFFLTMPEYKYDWIGSMVLGTYDFSNAELIDFVRDKFKIGRVDRIPGSEHMLDQACKYAYNSMLWYGKSTFNTLEVALKSKNAMDFRIKFFENLKQHNIDYKNGGGYTSIDNLCSIRYGFSKDAYLVLKQNINQYREFYGSTEGLEVDDDEVILYKISANEVVERVYKIYESKNIEEYALKRLLEFDLSLEGNNLSHLNTHDGYDMLKKSYHKSTDKYRNKTLDCGRLIFCENSFNVYEKIEHNEKKYSLHINRRSEPFAYEYSLAEIDGERKLPDIVFCQGVDNVLKSYKLTEIKKVEDKRGFIQPTLFDFLEVA